MPRTARPGARVALLDAAREEFARHGLERARVGDIARRGGISKGGFYLHFAAKEEAFREVVSRFLGALEERARRRDELEERSRPAQGRSFRDAAVAAVAADVDLLDLLWRNRRILAALDGAPDRLRRDLDDILRKIRALVARRMADGTSAGAGIRGDVPSNLLAEIVVGTYRDFARRMLELRDRPDLEAWARALRAVLYEGILERPGRATRGFP